MRKIPYEMPLREAFQKMLKAEFLPMLRVNRYDLTKLSLYGFDIYVPVGRGRSNRFKQCCRSWGGWKTTPGGYKGQE